MEEEVPDFISNLPHDVLLRIVSMVPLKESIRTYCYFQPLEKLFGNRFVLISVSPVLLLSSYLLAMPAAAGRSQSNYSLALLKY